MNNKPLRVLYFGTYRTNYTRNQIFLKGLRANGVEVTECHVSLWDGIEDRVAQAKGGWKHPRFWLRLLRVYGQLMRQHRQTPPYDVMFIGYPGPFDSFLGRFAAWRRRKPMALDHYMSLYLIAVERGLTAKSPWSGRLIRLLEAIGLRLNNLIIADTVAYRDYHCRTYRLRPSDFALIPAGMDEAYFYPRPEIKPPTGSFHVAYHGTFLHSHGMQTVVRAAKLLADTPRIQFDFYGEGPEQAGVEALVAELGVSNIHFHGWVEKDTLPQKLAASHVILGVFGSTQQSLGTIQNKVWEGMAMGRAVISGDSATVRADLTHGEHLYLVAREDAAALAAAIRLMMNDDGLRARLEIGSAERATQNNSTALGRQLKQVLGGLAGRN